MPGFCATGWLVGSTTDVWTDEVGVGAPHSAQKLAPEFTAVPHFVQNAFPVKVTDVPPILYSPGNLRPSPLDAS
jgi:hypothetical protein